MAYYEAVARTEDLGPGEIREVHAHGRTLALTNFGQIYYALEAYCPNDGTNLAEDGRLDGDRLVCPNDDRSFDVRTGEAMEPAGGPPLQRYGLKIEENEIRIGPALESED